MITLIFGAVAVAVLAVFHFWDEGKTPSEENSESGLVGDSRGQEQSVARAASPDENLVPATRSEAKIGIPISVSDCSGSPIENARAFLVPVGELRVASGIEACANRLLETSKSKVYATNSDGFASVLLSTFDKQVKDYLLVVDAENFVAHGRIVKLLEYENRLPQNFKLPAGYRGQVSVIGSNGRAIDEARVSLVLQTPPLPGSFLQAQELTGSNGVALIDSLQEGGYLLEVLKEGFIPSRNNEVLLNQEQISFEVSITLERSATITGNVRDANGEVVAGARVSAVPTHQGNPQWLELRYSDSFESTDASGEFVLHGLQRNRFYTIVAAHGSSWTASDPIEPPSRVELRLPNIQLVRARVVDMKQQPVEGAQVALLDTRCEWAAEEIAMAKTDVMGQVELRVADGEYGVAVIHESGELLLDKPITVFGETDLGDLILPTTGSVVFQGVDRSSGKPVEGLVVRPLKSKKDGFNSTGSWENYWQEVKPRLHKMKSKVEGEDQLLLKGLSPGTHKFHGIAPGYAAAEIDVEVESDQVIVAQFLLTPSSELLIRVVDPSGLPVAAQMFSLIPSASPYIRNPYQMSTDEQGMVRYKNLIPGRYEFLFATNGATKLTLAEFDVEIGQNEGEAVLDLLSGVRVHVSDAGVDCVDCQVFLFHEYPQVEGQRKRGMSPASGACQTDADGMAELPPILAGDYIIGVQPEGGMPLRTHRTLSSSGQVVEITLAARASISGRVLPASGGVEVSMVQYLGMDGLIGAARLRASRTSILDHGIPFNQVSFADNGFSIKSKTTTDDKGNFIFSDLSPGECHLFALGDNGQCSTVTPVKVSQSDVTGIRLQLIQFATLTVEFSNIKIATEENGYRSISARLLADGTNELFATNRMGGDRGPQASFEDSGQIEVNYLPPGPYTLQIKGWSRDSNGNPQPFVEVSFELQEGDIKSFTWDGQVPGALH
ncbi:MAG: hypothetical protein HQ519_19755 [Planctomycetes bacterium]|nr:hypothetical protein [Planctomycetota bacterium]